MGQVAFAYVQQSLAIVYNTEIEKDGYGVQVYKTSVVKEVLGCWICNDLQEFPRAVP